MSSPALRESWAEWRDFSDSITLSDTDRAGLLAMHARLFRLCGKHPLKAKHLEALRDVLRESFEPWLGAEADSPADAMQQLTTAWAACTPVWPALFMLKADRGDYWSELDREAGAVGLAWPEADHWHSPFFVGRFEPVGALHKQPRESAMASVVALWDVVGNEKAKPLWFWLRNTARVDRPAKALESANVLAAAIREGTLTAENVKPLRLADLIPRLARLCENFALNCLRRLNEDVPVAVVAVPSTSGGRVVRPARAIHRREVPEPLPVEPFFRKIDGAEAFLRAVAEEPLEDAHRLAFADWLDDNGYAARAEFIRVQCQQASLPAFHPVREWCEVRCGELLGANAAEWTAGLEYGEKKPWTAKSFQRGLLEQIELPEGQTADALDAQFQQADVRSLGAENVNRERFPVLMARPWLSRLTALRPGINRYQITRDEVRALGQAEALRGLSRLDLSAGRLYDDYLVLLFESLQLPALTSLSLASSYVGRTVAAALAARAWFRNVADLDVTLGGYSFGGPGLRALIASDNAAGLTSLNLSRCQIPGNAFEALANSPFMTNLKALALSGNHVGNVGTRALTRTPFMKKLTALNLSNTEMKGESVRVLVKSALFKGLQLVDLGSNKLSEDCVAELTGAAESPALQALSLRANELTDGMLTALGGAAVLKHVAALDLRDAKMSDAGARALLASAQLGKLTHLDLRGNSFGKAVKAALLKRWPFVLT